jgi:hypothetical protein
MMGYYKCVELSKRYTGRMFKLGGVYRSTETEKQPAVIDELGYVRVIGSNLRFVVGHWGGLWPAPEFPIVAYFEIVPFAPAAAGESSEP